MERGSAWRLLDHPNLLDPGDSSALDGDFSPFRARSCSLPKPAPPASVPADVAVARTAAGTGAARRQHVELDLAGVVLGPEVADAVGVPAGEVEVGPVRQVEVEAGRGRAVADVELGVDVRVAVEPGRVATARHRRRGAAQDLVVDVRTDRVEARALARGPVAETTVAHARVVAGVGVGVEAEDARVEDVLAAAGRVVGVRVPDPVANGEPA